MKTGYVIGAAVAFGTLSLSAGISLEVPSDAFATVVIEEAATGRRVRNLMSARPMEAGTHTIEWDGYDDVGEPCAAGEYRWRGLTHGKIESRYAGSFYSPGDPPWRTVTRTVKWNFAPTGAGGWLSDHRPPLCAFAHGDDVYIGSLMAETGHAMIRIDAGTGRKTWGTERVCLGGASAFAMDGDTLFVASEGGWMKDKFQIVRINVKTNRIVNNPDEIARRRGGGSIHQQRESAFVRENMSDFSEIRGMTLTPDEIVVSLADKGGRIVCFSRKTAEFTREIALPGAGQLATAPDGAIWAVCATGVANVKLWNCENMELCKAVAGNSASLGSRSARLGRVPTGCGHPQGAVTRLCVKNDNHVENCELIVCDEARAKAEGFAVGSETNILRAAIPGGAAFRGVGPGDVRWPTGLAIRPLRGEGATPDGAFAVKHAGGRTLVFSQVPEGRFAARAAKRDQKKENPMANAERLDEGRVRRLYARLRTNCGNATNLDLRKALHKSGAAEYGPLPSMHLLGPFSAGKDNSKLMLDTVWSEKGEEMAIQGDFDPNHEFALPQGGTANWRPMLAPSAEGVFDFTTIQPVASFPVTYAICHVERKTAGDAILKLGGDWRFKVWCNGKEVFRAESGARIPRFELKVPLKAGDNVLAFKVGAGSGGHKIIALLAAERGDGADEEHDEELDSMTLYDDDVMGFDPYEFHYW